MSQTLRADKVNSVKVHTTICATCLSSDRILYPMKLLPHLMNICNGITLTMKDNICWECKAQLLKTMKFRNKAVRSQSVLACLAHIKRVSTSGQQGVFVESLSSLSKNELFQWGVASGTDIKEEVIEVLIKEEISDNEANDELLTKDEESQFDPLKLSAMRELLADSDNASSNRNPIIKANVEGITMQTMVEEESEAEKDDSHNFNEVEMMQSREQVEESEFIPLKPSVEQELSTDYDNVGRNRETTYKANVEEITIQTMDEEDKEAPDKDDPHNFILKVMDEVEMMQYREEEKNKLWYKTSEYKCGTCIQTFPNVLVLEKHNELHSENKGSHVCRVCKQRFQFDNAMQIHTKAHYKYYKCRDCEFIHQHLDNMLAHRRSKHDYRIRQCDQCDAQFNSSRKLRYHKDLKHKALPHCDICGKQFAQKAYLKQHTLMHSTVPKVECTICHKQYRGEWGLRSHMRQHSDKMNEDAYCTECDAQFKDVFLYRAHLKYSRKHAAPETYRFECEDCNKKFIVKSSLRAHIETVHLQVKNYSCDVCDAKYYTSVCLNRHKRDKHSGRDRPRRHVCNICGKAFIKKQALEQHTNSHLGLRPYKCDVCGDSFSYNGALYTHNKLVHLKLQRNRAR